MAELREAWKLRCSLAAAMDQALDYVARQIGAATADELIDFCGSFYPGRAAGPEWIASFDRFVEQVWESADAEVIAAVEAAFRARGPLWAPIANAFTPEHGGRLRARHWRPAGARRPAVILR
ncbi:MAG: hypothetical protein U0531_10410 [Dehalococcoidia bacterium]